MLNLKKTIPAFALAGAMLLSGCKADDGNSGSDISITEPEPRSLSETISDMFGLKSSKFSFRASMSGTDPDTGAKQDISISFGGLALEDNKFEMNDITIAGTMLESSGLDIDAGGKSLRVGDLVFDGTAGYVNIDPLIEAMAKSGAGSGSAGMDKTGWIRVSQSDLDAVVGDIDASASGNPQDIADKASDPVNSLNSKFSDLMPKLVGPESDWISQNGENYSLHIDKNSVRKLGKNAIALIDDGTLKAFSESAKPDIEALLALVPDAGSSGLDINNIDDIDWDGLRSDIENADYDSMPDFSIDIKLSAASETSYSLTAAIIMPVEDGEPVSVNLKLDVSDAGDRDISVPEKFTDLSELMGSMPGTSGMPGYDYGDYDYDSAFEGSLVTPGGMDAAAA